MRGVRKKRTTSSGQNKITIDEILQKQDAKRLTKKDLMECNTQWLIDGFLVKETLTMFYAAAGSGKSYFVLYLSKFLLEKGKIQRVYYFDGDNSKASFKGRNGDKFIQNPNLCYYNELGNKKFTLFDALSKANDLSNTLIVIDSIRNFITGDFNKDVKVMKTLNKLQTLRDNGATVIFLHHQPKQKEDENNKTYKGATSFLDSVDEGYFLYSKPNKQNKNEFIIITEPQKHRFQTEPKAFKLNILNLSLENVDYLQYAETQKAQVSINLVKEILNEHKKLCQQDLVNKIKRKIEEDYVEIVGKNTLWNLLDKYDGVKWKITYQSSQTRGGKKKFFENIETKEQNNA